MILYICLSGLAPFNNNTLVEQIIGGKYEFRRAHFQNVSQDAMKLVRCGKIATPVLNYDSLYVNEISCSRLNV